MIFIEQVDSAYAVYYGGLTFFLFIIVLMHGYRNEVLAWPHALLILLFSPLFVFLYILVVLVQFRRENIWAEKPSAMNKYSVTRFPAKWKGEAPSKQPRRKRRPSNDDEFDGYESPPDWDI